MSLIKIIDSIFYSEMEMLIAVLLTLSTVVTNKISPVMRSLASLAILLFPRMWFWTKPSKTQLTSYFIAKRCLDVQAKFVVTSMIR